MMYNYKDFESFEVFMEAEMEHILLLEKYGKKDEALSEETDLLHEVRKHIDRQIKNQKKEKVIGKRLDRVMDFVTKTLRER